MPLFFDDLCQKRDAEKRITGRWNWICSPFLIPFSDLRPAARFCQTLPRPLASSAFGLRMDKGRSLDSVASSLWTSYSGSWFFGYGSEVRAASVWIWFLGNQVEKELWKKWRTHVFRFILFPASCDWFCLRCAWA